MEHLLTLVCLCLHDKFFKQLAINDRYDQFLAQRMCLHYKPQKDVLK